jgi:hypothetical protein
VPSILRTLLYPKAPPEEVVQVGRRGLLYSAAVFAVAAVVLASIQFQQKCLLGADAYHHTRVAKIIADSGIIHDFPWTQASVFKDSYADKQFLFHVLLIPFLGSDLTFGPKLLTVILTALSLALLAWITLRHGIGPPWLWVTIVLASGVMFLFRMSLTRPHLLAVPLALLTTHCLLRRHVIGLFLCALAFPLCYTAAHLPLALFLVYALVCLLRREPFPWQLMVAVVAGSALGVLLHPHSEHLLQLWYMQNVSVVLNVWQIPDDVVMGTEFFSIAGSVIFFDVIILWLGLGGVALLVLTRRVRLSLRTLYLLLLSGAFFVMFLLIPRFVEYLVPFTVLFMASATADQLAGFDLKDWLIRRRLSGSLVLGLSLTLLLVQTTRSVVESQIEVERDRSLHFQKEARWIDENLAPGELVFTGSWDSFPYLFHFAPRQHYLVALDPTFMQAFDPGLFEDWYRIANGRVEDPYARILLRFKARFVLAERKPWIEPFISQMVRDPKFMKVFDGPDAAIFVLAPDLLPAARSLVVAGVTLFMPASGFSLGIKVELASCKRNNAG